MLAIRTYLSLLLLLSSIATRGMDIQQLRQRNLHVRVVYSHAANAFLQKVHSF